MSPKPHIGRWLHGSVSSSARRLSASSKQGGHQNRLNLRSATWSNTAEKHLMGRTAPGFYEGAGQANPTATVTVNAPSTYRRGEYFRTSPQDNVSQLGEAGVPLRTGIHYDQ